MKTAAPILVRYFDNADKQTRYLRETIPAIFSQAADAAQERRFWEARSFAPAQIHANLRAGRYVPEDGAQDEVETVDFTQTNGGDCEDWAAVALTEYWRTGHTARLVTAGDSFDNFQHAYVEVLDNGKWVPSDPKGNQAGSAYGVRNRFEVTRRFEWRDGHVVELARGSGAVTFGGVDISEFVSAKYLGAGLYQAKRANGTTQVVAKSVADAINAKPVGPALPSVAIDDDKFLAVYAVSLIPSPNVFELSDAAQITGTEDQRREGLADALLLMARMRNTTLRAMFAQAGLVAPALSTQGSAGIFDKLGDKVQGAIDKGSQIVRAVQTGVGVALQQVGGVVLKLGDKYPWFNQFVAKPLCINLIATSVAELGNAVRDGSINTFDEKKVTRSMASWFKAVGAALAVAAPFTGPWAPLFSACAAANIAIGTTLNATIDRMEAARAAQNAHDNPGAQRLASGVYQFDWGSPYGVLYTFVDANGTPTHVWINNGWVALT